MDYLDVAVEVAEAVARSEHDRAVLVRGYTLPEILTSPRIASAA